MKYNTQTVSTLIEILGSKRIEEIYSLVGAEPVSFSMLHSIVRSEKILKEIKAGKKIQKIASENSVSCRTVYRLMRK